MTNCCQEGTLPPPLTGSFVGAFKKGGALQQHALVGPGKKQRSKLERIRLVDRGQARSENLVTRCPNQRQVLSASKPCQERHSRVSAARCRNEGGAATNHNYAGILQRLIHRLQDLMGDPEGVRVRPVGDTGYRHAPECQKNSRRVGLAAGNLRYAGREYWTHLNAAVGVEGGLAEVPLDHL